MNLVLLGVVVFLGFGSMPRGAWSWVLVPTTTTTRTPRTTVRSSSRILRSSLAVGMSNSNNNHHPTTTQTTTPPLNDDQCLVTFVRHGCSYMNEYLGGSRGGKAFGQPGFTDVFRDDTSLSMYRDAPLSPRGHQQVQALNDRMARERAVAVNVDKSPWTRCDLVVVSPLTRALQTYRYGLHPHLQSLLWNNNNNQNSNQSSIVAWPEAAERLYLISDVGRSVNDLQPEFPFVDFHACRQPQQEPQLQDNDLSGGWWWSPQSLDSYIEWRPTGRRQRYACPGEPQDVFDHRMTRLYHKLQNAFQAQQSQQNDSQSPLHIVVVCHHGVMQWMLQSSFANCQYRTVRWADLSPPRLQEVVGDSTTRTMDFED